MGINNFSFFSEKNKKYQTDALYLLHIRPYMLYGKQKSTLQYSLTALEYEFIEEFHSI